MIDETSTPHQRAPDHPVTELAINIPNASEDGTGEHSETPSPGETVVLEWSDLGNGKRFVEEWGDRVLYNHTYRAWFIWDDQRWVQDEKGWARELAKWVANKLYTEMLLHREADEKDPNEMKHAKYSNSNLGISNMLTAASTIRRVAVTVDELDQHPFLLNLANGTLNLKEMDFVPHERSYRITKLADVELSPEAACPQWLAFLDRIFVGKQSMISYVQRTIGYSLSGWTSEQCFFMLYGTGANGKSTFLNVIAKMLGDYSKQTPFETILQKKYESETRSDLAALVGARFVRASEGDKGRRLAESVVKMLTGEDEISVRKLRENFFIYRPQFKLFVATNHKPRIPSRDYGMWRRIKVIPFTVEIPPAERDSHLEEKLLAELPGILWWAVEGFRQWRTMGLSEPEEVRAATAEYQAQETDIVTDFLTERCTLSAALKVEATQFYSSFAAYADEQKEIPRSAKWLYQQLIEHKELEVYRSNGRRWIRGVNIIGDAPAQLPLEGDPF